MSSSLLSNINSRAQHQANLLTNSPNTVKVIVEDELDVVIWHRILNFYAPTFKYDVHPYSYDPSYPGKGKAQILSQASQFGRYLIGCVDSDNDWLLSQWTADGVLMKGCPFILQTYAYSIENLAAQPYGIEDCMIECYMHCCEATNVLDIKFEAFLKDVSISVYDTLLWHLTMNKEDVDVTQISIGWDYVFGNGHYNDIHNNKTLSVEEKHRAILERFIARTSELVTDYKDAYPQLIPARQDLEVYLKSDFDLTPQNAYLYVRGHNLHDFLIYNYFTPVQNYIKKLHEDEIRAHTTGKDTFNAIHHYHNLIKDFDRDYIHRHSYLEHLDPAIAIRLQEAIAAIFDS